MADQQDNLLRFDHKGLIVDKTGSIFGNPTRVVELLLGMVEELGTTLGTTGDTNFKRFSGRLYPKSSEF
jgi:hypothetical protein